MLLKDVVNDQAEDSLYRQSNLRLEDNVEMQLFLNK